MKKILISALVLSSALAAQAQIAPAQFSPGQAVTGKFNRVGDVVNGTVFLDSNAINVAVGRLIFDWTPQGGVTFTGSSICADLNSRLDGNGHTYTTSLTPEDNSGLSKAAKIIATYFTTANTAQKAAGLQLAVWEALYDNGSSYNNGGGRFRAGTEFGDAMTAGTAANYAAQYYSATSGRAILVGTGASGGQSQIVPVPEPASLAAIAIGAFGILRRRSRRTR